MATLNELRGLDTFLVTALKNDAALTALVGTRIATRGLPQGATGPAVLIAFLSGRDVNALGNSVDKRILSQIVYAVRGVCGPADVAQQDPIADRLDAVLHGLSGSVPGDNLFIHGVEREEILRSEEVNEGVYWYYLGGRYRCTVSRIS